MPQAATAGTKELLEAVIEEHGTKCRMLPAQTLSNVLWALAHLQQSKDIGFFSALAEACELKIGSFEPQVGPSIHNTCQLLGQPLENSFTSL